MKNLTTRITDTLTFLSNTNLVLPAERQAAHQFATAFINAQYPAINALQPGYIAFSKRMGLGYHLFSDPTDRRKACRAIYLLWSAMHQSDPNFTIPLQSADQIVEATSGNLLAAVIRKARIMHEGPGTTLGLAHVLNTVIPANPLDFLKNNKIFILGSSLRAGNQGEQNVMNAAFSYNPLHDRYQVDLAVLGVPGRYAFQVESVTAVHWTDVATVPGPLNVIGTSDLDNIRSIELSGANMMVTTQFTGCAFSMKEIAGVMYCAHVSPAGVPNKLPNTDGPTLAGRVIATGEFSNVLGGQHPLEVYGRNTGTNGHPRGYDIGLVGGADTYMSIIGLAAGNSYHIYAQETMANAIRSAKRVFP